MTREIKLTRYARAICDANYSTEAEAALCESGPVREDRGVKIGDVVRVTGGDGAGLNARVEQVWIIDKDWGHYAAKRYWHTVAVAGKLIDSYGSRILTFDDYAITTPETT